MRQNSCMFVFTITLVNMQLKIKQIEKVIIAIEQKPFLLEVIFCVYVHFKSEYNIHAAFIFRYLEFSLAKLINLKGLQR